MNRNYLTNVLIYTFFVLCGSIVDSQEFLNDFQPISVMNLSQIAPAIRVDSQTDIIDLAFDVSATHILTISTDGMLRRWDLQQSIHQVLWQGQPMSIATLSANGAYMVCVCSSSSDTNPYIKLVETSTGSEIISIAFGDIIHDLTISPNGETIGALVGSSAFNFRVELWNTYSGELERAYTGYRWGNDVILGNQALLGVSYGHLIRIWDILENSDALIFEQYITASNDDKTLGSLSREVIGFAFNSNEKHLATMSNDGLVWLWNIDTEALMFTLVREHIVETDMFSDDRNISRQASLVFHPQAEILVTNDLNQIAFWDLKRQVLEKTFPLNASHIAFSPDGTLFATSDTKGQIIVWGVLVEN